MTIVAPRPLLVRVDLAEKDLQHVRHGMSGNVVPAGFPNVNLAVRLAHLSQIPISSGVFDCQLRVNDRQVDRGIVPGMSCKGTLLTYENEKAVTVPPAGVFAEEAGSGKKHYVYLAKPDDQHVKRPVVLGKRTEDKVEILKGLKAGDEILLQKPSGD
jgi:multidrug efflux pump subunit AcrA (membrane-fusion protein)